MIRVNNFDVLRLLAALLVVYGHAFPLTGLDSKTFSGNFIQSIGVKIFFVISGYLIVGSWLRDPSVVRYVQRRALRIMPGLVAVVVVSAACIGLLVTTLPAKEYLLNSRTWSYVISNILLKPQYDLPGVFLANPYPVAVNGSLWSLPAEVAMYVLAPMVCWAGLAILRSERWGVACATVALVLTSIWFVRVVPPSPAPVFYGNSVLMFLDVAPYFLIGALYKLFDWSRYLRPVWAAIAWIMISLVQFQGIAAELSLYLVLPYTVLALGVQHSDAGARLSRFGDISYGVYLYGFPIQQLVTQLPSFKQAGPAMNVMVSLPLLICVATLSWRLVEQPMLRFKATTPKNMTFSNS